MLDTLKLSSNRTISLCRAAGSPLAGLGLVVVMGGAVGCGAASSNSGPGSESESGESGETGEGSTTGGEEQGRPTSGTRLLVQFLEAQGGARVFERVYDSELETTCSPGSADDGQTRCLPKYYLDVVYLDAGCTQPVFMGQTSEFSDFAYARTRSTSCDHNSAYTTYRIDWDSALPEQNIHRRGPEGCTPAQPAFDPLFAVTEIPAAQLVGLERRERPLAEGLVALSYDGDDGSVLPGGYWDADRGHACDPSELDGRCVPAIRTSVSAGRFADDACSERLGEPLYGDATCAPNLLVERGDQSDVCNLPAPRYFEPGMLVTQTWEFDGDACNAGTPGAVGVALGAELAAQELPTLVAGNLGDAEAGAVLESVYFDAAGEWAGGRGLWVEDWGALCAVQENEAGQLYCGAVGAPIVFEAGGTGPTAWSNPDCTGTVLAEVRGCEGTDRLPVWAPESGNWYEQGPVFTGEASFEFQGFCMPFEAEGSLVELGPAIPVADMPQLTRVDG